MNLSDKVKQHVDSCRFCWMCHHICPIGNATGHERSTARARALGISLVNRNAIELEEIMDNIYECTTCGACTHDCVTGWDPVMFAKEVRLEAAIDGKLPKYINTLLDNCLETGNAYGKTEVDQPIAAKFKAHAAKTDTLFVLGADATYLIPTLAIKAMQVLDKAGVCYTILENEPATGSQLDFLIGAADETKSAMEAFAEVANQYKNVVLYDPVDAKTVKQTFKEYGVEVKANVYTYTSLLAELVKEGKLSGDKKDLTVVYQDPYAHARDLGETEPAREVISAFANLHEFHLNRKETVFAGSLLMAEYMPKVMNEVASRRIFNATAVNENVIVTASPAEYVCLKAVDQDKVQILSIEDVIL